MKKVSRTNSLAERMVEPIRGRPDIWNVTVNMETTDIIALRGISGKSSDKDLAKEIKRIVREYIHTWQQKDLEKRSEDMGKYV